MNAQLARWDTRIHQLATAAECDPQTSLAEHQRLDELRACRATARTQLDEFQAAEAEHRRRLEPALQQAWNELAAAMRRLAGPEQARPERRVRRPAGGKEQL